MDALFAFVFFMFAAILLVGGAQKISLAYPIALILGGGIIGLIPGLEPIDLDPRLLLVIVLPPILFYAAYSIAFKEFIRYFRDIFYLGIVLVAITTVVAGVLFKWLFPELPWALAFTFGAIISPPDAVAATAILKNFTLSSRLKTILEGESLINDASGLVIYKFAVLALMTGEFSLKEAAVDAIYAVVVGILIGLVCGYLFNKLSSFLNPVLAVVHSFIIPYMTYCLADFFGASGVLAVVSCGLLGARMLITQLSPLTRVLAWVSWDILVLLLNCFIFILIGLDFGQIVQRMPLQQIWLYSGYGILITIAIILVRFICIYIRRGFVHLFLIRNPALWSENRFFLKHALISSWAGMRGVVSLTAALAIPFSRPDGSYIEGRDIVIFLTFEVIFLTLVIPGLTLSPLIKWLKIPAARRLFAELVQARKKLVRAAIDEIQHLHAIKHLNEGERELLNMYFHSRHKIIEFSSISEEHKIEQTRHHIVQKQREYLVRMWRSNEIDDELMGRLERELDLEEAHLARGEM
jgi:CPA1 family monovalent cation:H+ antiporter